MILELILNMFVYKRVFFEKNMVCIYEVFFLIKEIGKVNKLNKLLDLCEILECDV